MWLTHMLGLNDYRLLSVTVCQHRKLSQVTFIRGVRNCATCSRLINASSAIRVQDVWSYRRFSKICRWVLLLSWAEEWQLLNDHKFNSNKQVISESTKDNELTDHWQSIDIWIWIKFPWNLWIEKPFCQRDISLIVATYLLQAHDAHDTSCLGRTDCSSVQMAHQSSIIFKWEEPQKQSSNVTDSDWLILFIYLIAVELQIAKPKATLPMPASDDIPHCTTTWVSTYGIITKLPSLIK